MCADCLAMTEEIAIYPESWARTHLCRIPDRFVSIPTQQDFMVKVPGKGVMGSIMSKNK